MVGDGTFAAVEAATTTGNRIKKQDSDCSAVVNVPSTTKPPRATAQQGPLSNLVIPASVILAAPYHSSQPRSTLRSLSPDYPDEQLEEIGLTFEKNRCSAVDCDDELPLPKRVEDMRKRTNDILVCF
jgi:hypothetical protein